jgi:hypothetical protein
MIAGEGDFMVPLIEVSDSDTQPKGPPLVSAASRSPRCRCEFCITGPLPEGFVVPPGIDIEALLK